MPEGEATISRAEHLAWCKKRALEYCDVGEDTNAFMSLVSDLGKHPGTAHHVGIQLGMKMLYAGLGVPGGMRTYIEGFN